jgi:hypothetical protein
MQTLHELVNKVTEWNKLRYVQHSISFADGQPNMHVGIFPDGHFKKQFKCAIKFTDTNEKKEWLAGFEKRVNAQKYNPDLVQELKETLDAFDKRRGTDWRKLWPWLDQYEL